MRDDTYSDQSPLSDISARYLEARPKVERGPLGQFLTPKILREALADAVRLEPGMRVLDPGVGTGEFLRTCLDREPTLACTGWDIDPPVLQAAKALVPEADLRQQSALEIPESASFDLVIGNPPYYEMRSLAADLRERYSEVISGRPNIFALFFLVGYNALRSGGQLAYVVPPSMNNGAYFDKLRNFLLRHFSIEYLRVFENPFLFEDAQTAVQLIVLEKGKSSEQYTADLAALSGSPKARTIFTDRRDDLISMFDSSSTLHSLGYKAVTGSVVWNTKRDQLSSTSSADNIPLIWAHNITDGDYVRLTPDHPKRPQFIRGARPLIGPAIVVNRITGSVGSGKLRCALVPDGMEFVAENHVNVILPRPNVPQLASWQGILAALKQPETNGRIRLLTGNTQVSATELTNWVPLRL